ncbi:MAG: nucleotidyl transferase AbiEii/AbiGii toxin family protein [bacterium]
MATILTPNQVKTLSAIATSNLAKEFYFSGGTALSHYYLQHRLSEDLDFFRTEEFDVQSVYVALKLLKSKVGYDKVDFQSSMNRNLFFLHFPDKTILKLEFTYYPFEQVESPKIIDGLKVDSAIDIATNKLFTIVQTPRGRDYYDLYFLITKYGYTIPKLRMLAKQKFDWHIDPLMLASQLDKASKFLDDPILTKGKDTRQIFEYFENETGKLRSEIISK